MADPLSIALSLAGVAETGFKLVDTIYAYTSSVRKAERQLRPIAEYVQITALAFQHIAKFLNDDETRAFYTADLLSSTANAVGRCKEAFERLDKFIEMLSCPVRNEDGTITSTATNKTKLSWHWKHKDLEVEQRHLERCKSTVQILLQTMTLISASRGRTSSSRLERDLMHLTSGMHELVVAERQRKQIGTHNKTVEEAISETESGSFSSSVAPSMKTSRGQISDIDSASTSLSESSEDDVESDEELLACLSECAAATKALSTNVNRVAERLKHHHLYSPGSLRPEFEALRDVIDKLASHEQKSRQSHYQALHMEHAVHLGSERSECRTIPSTIPGIEVMLVEDTGKLRHDRRSRSKRHFWHKRPHLRQ